MKLSYKVALILTFCFVVGIITYYTRDDEQPQAKNMDLPDLKQADKPVASTPKTLSATSKTPRTTANTTRSYSSPRNSTSSSSTALKDKMNALRSMQKAQAPTTANNKPTTTSRNTRPTLSSSPITKTTTTPVARTTLATPKPLSTPTTARNTMTLGTKASPTALPNGTRASALPTQNTFKSSNTKPVTTSRSLITNLTRPKTTKPATSTSKSYTVKSGDSLYKISKKVFGDVQYWDEIAQANPNLDPARIHPGDTINLPDIARLQAERSRARKAASSKSSNKTAATNSHKVQSGETLSSISEKFYGTPNRWRDIYNANRKKMKDPDAIQPGMVISVPK
ncbi:LysM peptidoglycan-binding domain-containing protein [Poriferisphaera sp. WC338]|uniref:LysM peptidoglycan-binding domain-containing protein n=1 Tax=Poriferisphaera sp. WC338 TaxID=3425129 RepID=UPI003D81527A